MDKFFLDRDLTLFKWLLPVAVGATYFVWLVRDEVFFGTLVDDDLLFC